MTDENIDDVYKLYENYTDEKEKCKIVTIQDLKDHDYTLSVNTYIEREEKETIDPEVVKQEFLDALSDVIKAEDKFKALLIKGGYINEQ